jgi:[glutamine synthetase] adenylyltransferase / [glutamine synthetase]-adenylyl-L-tyrosine phosphorylase
VSGDSDLADLGEGSADPGAVRGLVGRLGPEARERLDSEPALTRAVVTVVAASRSLTRQLEADPGSWDVLADLDRPVVPSPPRSGGTGSELAQKERHQHASRGGEVGALVQWYRRAYLRVAARDLLGLDPLDVVTTQLSDLAAQVCARAVDLVGAEDMAVVGMGKFGAHELNYASDVDILLVGGATRQARDVVRLAGHCFRVDANLRPEGRNGPLTRSLDSYRQYWQRWADPWEFQALLKARPVAGDPGLGAEWGTAAHEALWERPWTRDDLRSLRDMKARSETAALGRDGARDLKRAPGGLRDIEFAVQILQLVHGRTDPALRSPATLSALAEMVQGGYVADADAGHLAEAYRFLRRAEHALQLDEGQQTHTLPADRTRRRRVARVLGYRGTPEAGPTEAFDRDVARHRSQVRAVHEQLYFRPLLDALAGAGRLSPATAEAALATFGFADVERARQAVTELTRGLTRSSRMMQQLLPLLLDWLSTTPDPDGGLLGLRKLATGELRARQLAGAFRDSAEVARRLCELVGTSGLATDILVANPDLIPRLADAARLRTQPLPDLVASAHRALGWRENVDEMQQALRRWRLRHLLGVMARDVYAQDGVDQVGRDLAVLADACVESAVAHVSQVEDGSPLSVVALGRGAGREMAYGSDVDLIFVHGGGPGAQQPASKAVTELMRFLGGASPAQRIFAVDADLRPEGRNGPLVRSLDGYRAYFGRWALTWERQALARARPVAGDPGLGAAFMALVDEFVWGRPFTTEDEREVRRVKARVEKERLPLGEDPDFHLKLGRGALTDIEWTVQLLQLRHGLPEPATMTALERLQAGGYVEAHDARVLAEAYRFCEQVRNRWWLVRSGAGSADALPQHGEPAARLARSLGTSTAELRDEYRRLTRRSRQVVERLFYGH